MKCLLACIALAALTLPAAACSKAGHSAREREFRAAYGKDLKGSDPARHAAGPVQQPVDPGARSRPDLLGRRPGVSGQEG
jgi:hypothetical protein